MKDAYDIIVQLCDQESITSLSLNERINGLLPIDTVSPFYLFPNTSFKDPRNGKEYIAEWKEDDEVIIKSFANNIDTVEGGTHEQGMRTSITSAINSFAKARSLHQDISLTGEDIREGG